MTLKTCKKCGVEKPITEYSYKRPTGRKPGYQPRCKSCAAEDTRQWNLKNKSTARDRYLRRVYGIGEKEYDSLLLSQGNRCLLCNTEFIFGEWGPDSPVVDHCHIHGHVRGILCNECNRGLGYFHDNKEALMNAVKYLARSDLNLEGGQ